jgi:GNAT superfamily N-acetyltransferase
MRSIREVCVKDHGEDEVRGWGNRPLGNRWGEAIKNGEVWVVELDGQVFGQGFIRISHENGEAKAHIYGLYLTPEVLGQGIGFQLANILLDTAKKAGAKNVTLDSTITAHDFYRSLGFVDTGPMSQQELGGHTVRYFPMALRLK